MIVLPLVKVYLQEGNALTGRCSSVLLAHVAALRDSSAYHTFRSATTAATFLRTTYRTRCVTPQCARANSSMQVRTCSEMRAYHYNQHTKCCC
jgi:hypothetical protein